MTNLLSKYHKLALKENSHLAGESCRIKKIAFRILSVFQPASEVPVWKPPLTVCWAQLPIFTVFSCPFAISISSSLFKTSQFTFGPSIASWKMLASFNPEVESFIYTLKEIISVGSLQKLRMKVSSLHDAAFIVPKSYVDMEFKLSSNDKEKYSDKLICFNNSPLQ